jgi:hypothetical protein
MFNYIALVVVIIILIIVIYRVFIGNSDKSKRGRAETFYQNSSGTFDENARRALVELTQIDNPQPQDRFRRANIIEYNILEGNTQRRASEGENGRRTRINAIGNITRDYVDTLRGLRGHVRDIHDTDFNPGFMINRIENFGERAMWETDDDLLILFQGLNTTLANEAPAVRREIIEDRKERAINNAENMEEAIDNYFEDAVKYTSDAQNVHDSKVNEDLRRTLRKLRSSTGRVNVSSSINQARDYIRNVYALDPANTHKVTNALAVLNTIEKGERITTFDDNEDNIFAYTWERCNHPNNADNEENLKEAVINALADSIERGAQVCINGRTSRVLNSLASLDFDEEVGNAMTYEAYKNQIFTESQEIIKQEIRRAKESDMALLRAVGESYEGRNVNVDPDVEEKFKEEVKMELSRNVERYADRLTDKEINQLKEECYAAID